MTTKTMPTKLKNPFQAHTREFYTPEDFRDRTFFDAFADAFTSPEDLTLHQTDYGFMARFRDGNHIREYFRKAVAQEEKLNNRSTTA